MEEGREGGRDRKRESERQLVNASMNNNKQIAERYVRWMLNLVTAANQKEGQYKEQIMKCRLMDAHIGHNGSRDSED